MLEISAFQGRLRREKSLHDIMEKNSPHAPQISAKVEKVLRAYAKNRSLRKTVIEVGLSRGRVWEVTKQYGIRLAEVRRELANATQAASESARGQGGSETTATTPPQHTEVLVPGKLLSKDERSELDRCESFIRGGLRTFFDVGQALETIRNLRLFRDGFETFEEYCRVRWGISKTHANRQIAAADVMRLLNDKDAEGLTEWDIRPLTRVPKKTAVGVWKEAKEKAKSAQVAVSNKILEAVVSQVAGTKPKTRIKGKTSTRASTVLEELMRAVDDAEVGIKAEAMADVAAALRRIRSGLERLARQRRAKVR